MLRLVTVSPVPAKHPHKLSEQIVNDLRQPPCGVAFFPLGKTAYSTGPERGVKRFARALTARFGRRGG